MLIITNFIKLINNFLWGYPMIILLLGVHIYFSIKLKFIQKNVFKAFKIMFTPTNKSNNISAFSTLTTTLAATLGTGNIIGVSTAIALGGPGAVFWCWISGLLGMATSYAECYLSCLFKKSNSNNSNKKDQYIGGPMYVLETGIKSPFLGILFALFTVLASFGVGCSTQSNSISASLFNTFNISPSISGFVCAMLVGFVIVGGFNSISKICMKLVPSMALFYTIGCFIILYMNKHYILESIILILKCAFNIKSCVSGICGISIGKCIRYGISRGLFTNEAGLGSTPITASMGNSHTNSEQSLISMTATFLDTVVMCAITGVTIISTLLSSSKGIETIYTDIKSSTLACTDLIVLSFKRIPYVGDIFLSISLVSFAYATLIGWFTFGEKAFEYIFKNKYLNTYKILYITMIYVGAVISLDLVWEMCDLFNALMAIPNIISLFILRKYITYSK